MSDWRWTTIGEVTDNFDRLRRPVKASERMPGSVPYYGASGVIDFVAGHTHEGTYLLVAEDGENLRSRSVPVAFIARGKSWVNNHAHVIAANDSSDTRFLQYVFATNDLTGYLTGSAQPKLSRAALDSIAVRLPPVREQRAIAEVLGALDDKIAANAKVSASAHALAEELYAARTSTAERRDLLEVLEPLSGGTPSRKVADYWGGDVPWVSAKDIASATDGVVVQTGEHITAEATDRTRVKPVPRGSVILTARGTVGRVARLGVDAAFNQSCFGFLPGALPPGLLYFAIRDVAEQAASLTHGSVFDTISLATFRHISVPDVAEPAVLESQLRSLLDRIQGAAEESMVLLGTRDALLPLLMSGKVRVKDAEKIVEGIV